MVAVMLLLIAGGIGLAQAVSDPHQVTLRWLRLGGIIALSLIAVAGTILALSNTSTATIGVVCGFPAGLSMLQLLAVQTANRAWQRAAALVSCFTSCAISAMFLHETTLREKVLSSLEFDLSFPPVVLSLPMAAGLTGGFLMTMLLGHAYLTAGSEMTQKPFARLVKVLAVLLVLRAVASLVFGLWPYMSLEVPRSQQMWNTLMVTTRYGVGLIVPGVFTYMIWDCVKRRANQSATGILYVATVLVMIGEGIALGLIGETGCVF